MCFSATRYKITPENTKEKKIRNNHIKLCKIDRKKCRKECLAPKKACPFIKRVIRC